MAYLMTNDVTALTVSFFSGDAAVHSYRPAWREHEGLVNACADEEPWT